MGKIARENFIRKAKSLYSNNDYTNIEYIDFYSKIKIHCMLHGDFEVTPRSHLNGCGCPKCQTKKFDLFLRKAKNKFGDKYTYISFNDYDFHPKNKINIICPIHGSFYQTTYNHIRGNGCPKCSYENESAKNSLGYFEFVKRSNKIHEGKYNYNNVEYINNRTKVDIICPIHGIFSQTPHDHLNGYGCPKCKRK